MMKEVSRKGSIMNAEAKSALAFILHPSSFIL